MQFVTYSTSFPFVFVVAKPDGNLDRRKDSEAVLATTQNDLVDLFYAIKRLLTGPRTLHGLFKTEIVDLRMNARRLAPATANSFLQILVIGSLGPNCKTELPFLGIENNAADVVTLNGGKSFSNYSKNETQPVLVGFLATRAWQMQAPLATLKVLGIFPLRFDAVLEKVVSVSRTKIGRAF